MIFSSPRNKVFAIGCNKTGTTSIASTLTNIGYKLGKQKTAELMVDEWAKRDFKNLIKYCKKSDAFQDVPFSLDYTYQAMDQAFPDSKFILTVRDDSDAWYNSLVRHQKKVCSTENTPPLPDDLKNCTYHGKGWLWKAHVLMFGINEETLFDKAIYTNHYEKHNANVLQYFKYRPEDLLVLNLKDEDATEKLAAFLEIDPSKVVIPHLNRTK